jgi:hypothetical protein
MATGFWVRRVAAATGDNGGTRSAAAAVRSAGHFPAGGPDPAAVALPTATSAGRPAAERPGAAARSGAAGRGCGVDAAGQAAAGHAALAAHARDHRG